jgi:hypothetical protein
MNIAEMEAMLISALRDLFLKEADIIERDVAERAIVGRLQHFLIPCFPSFSVDTEYDKHGINPKRLYLPPECRGGGYRSNAFRKFL